jgi:predicted MFS family arabinose efflux permease
MLLNGMDNLVSALYSFPSGYLTDKLGYKRALLVFNLISLLGYSIVILFPTWQAVFAGAIFFISWTAISLPAAGTHPVLCTHSLWLEQVNTYYMVLLQDSIRGIIKTPSGKRSRRCEILA